MTSPFTALMLTWLYLAGYLFPLLPDIFVLTEQFPPTRFEPLNTFCRYDVCNIFTFLFSIIPNQASPLTLFPLIFLFFALCDQRQPGSFVLAAQPCGYYGVHFSTPIIFIWEICTASWRHLADSLVYLLWKVFMKKKKNLRNLNTSTLCRQQ